MNAAKIFDAKLAQDLCDGEVPVFTNEANDTFYTYPGVAAKYIPSTGFELLDLSENEVQGTLPLPKGNRPLFPRNKAKKLIKAS